MKLHSLSEIEHAVEKLSPAEFNKFRLWFFQYDQNKWDKQLENDINSGKLDQFAKEAISEYETGKTKKL